MSAQLAQHFFPDLRAVRCGLEIQGIQREASGFHLAVVAADAVGIQHLLMLAWSGLSRDRGSQNQNCTYIKEALHGCGAIPSVISILVPHGSAMNATRIVLTKLLGVNP